MVKAFAILLSSLLPPGVVFWQTTNAGSAAGSQAGRDSGQAAGSQVQSNTQRSGSQQNRDQSPRRNPRAMPDDRRQFPQADDQLRDRNPRRRQTNQDQTDRDFIADRHLIAILAAQHQLMVNISQFGVERASSESVQNFASRMVDEHSDFLNRLASVSTSDLDDDPRREAEPIFTEPGRSGRTRQPNRSTNPNRDREVEPIFTEPDRSGRPRQPDRSTDPNSQPRQNQPQQPPQSALPDESVPFLADAPRHSFALAQVAFQTQRRNGTQTQTPGGTRTNPPLVTPGRSPDRSPTDDQDRNTRDTSRQASRRNRNGNNSIFDPNDSRFATNNPIARALQQVAGRRFSLVRSDLTDLSGDNFDRAFMQLMIGLHVEVIATESALASTSSPEVQQLIQENLGTEEQHLSDARSILSQLLGVNDSETLPTNRNLRTNNRSDQSTSTSSDAESTAPRPGN